MNTKAWVGAFRLRTLPLALSSIGMGSFLAAFDQGFRWQVLVLAGLTTLFLQILSNLANDYGDSIHGADSDARKGPSRAVQSGAISPTAMKSAIVLFSIFSLVSGLGLLGFSAGYIAWQKIAVLLGLGIVSIVAAITYTAGPKPYGYAGLGDVSVLLFFGFLAVGGTYFLHTGMVSWAIALPAASCGLFATAVLNVNNIRDIESDALAGKKSLPVRIGRSNAVVYHWFLLGTGITCAVIFAAIFHPGVWQWLFLGVFPLLVKNALAVKNKTNSAELDPYLKQMAITTLLFVLTFGIGGLLV